MMQKATTIPPVFLVIGRRRRSRHDPNESQWASPGAAVRGIEISSVHSKRRAALDGLKPRPYADAP